MKANELDGYRKSLLAEKERLSAALEHLHAENPGAENEDALDLSSLEQHLAEVGSITLDREMDYCAPRAACNRCTDWPTVAHRDARGQSARHRKRSGRNSPARFAPERS